MSLLEFHCRLRYSSGFALDADFRTGALITALCGPSGSGKTSILSMIAGLRAPDSGRIQLGDRTLFESNLHKNLPPEARRVGYVFQEHLLFPHLTVRRNLLYGRERRPRDARPVEFDRAIEVLELAGLLDRLPHTLSGGQRQRVALGRALLCGPELLLFDEPVASIDEDLKVRVLDYVEQVVREWQIPTIYVTHDLREVDRMAQWFVLVEHGKAVRSECVKPQA